MKEYICKVFKLVKKFGKCTVHKISMYCNIQLENPAFKKSLLQ